MTEEIEAYKPKRRIHQKHLLSLMDYTRTDIWEIMLFAARLKSVFVKHGKTPKLLRGKSLAMIFMRSNALARVSYEQGIRQLGGSAVYLSSEDLDLGHRETVHDTAKALSGYGIDALLIRTGAHADVVDLAKYGNFSVINGRSDDFHPCQALGDFLTLYERFGRLAGLKLCYIGAGNNVCHSLMIAGAKLGVEVVCVCPEGYAPNPDVAAYASRFADVRVTDDLAAAVKDANAIYTTVLPIDATERQKRIFAPYIVTEDMFRSGREGCVFMHPLPAVRNAEATANVVDAPYSVIYEQAANRLHIQKAVMALLMR